MKKLIGLVFLLSFTLKYDRVNIVNLEQLQHKTIKNNDTLYIVNFWATWCKPCVKELPYFQASAEKYSGETIKLIFVSLNSAKEIESVEKFTNSKQIKQEVLLLNAGNPNIWIDKIDSSWSGSIPATLLYRKGKKVFFKEGEFIQTELDSIIKYKLNN